MGKVIFLMNVSLDGYIETPDHSLDWTIVDDELLACFNERTRSIEALVHGRAKGLLERQRRRRVPNQPRGGAVALAGEGSGSASLDAALGLSYSAEVRGLLIAVGILGALVAVAISRLRSVDRPAAGPR